MSEIITETDINPVVARAVEICGSQRELARRCNDAIRARGEEGKVSQQHVWNWLRMKRIPAERAIPIEIAVAGQITRQHLRPDLFGPPPESPAADSEAA